MGTPLAAICWRPAAVSSSMPSLPMPELRMNAPGTARRSAVLSFMTCSFVWVATDPKTNREARGCATAEPHTAPPPAVTQPSPAVTVPALASQHRQDPSEERSDDRGLPLAQLSIAVLEEPPLCGAGPGLRQQAHRQLRICAREPEPIEVEFDPPDQSLCRCQRLRFDGLPFPAEGRIVLGQVRKVEGRYEELVPRGRLRLADEDDRVDLTGLVTQQFGHIAGTGSNPGAAIGLPEASPGQLR